MRYPSYSDGYGKAAHARSAHPYTPTHHRTAFLVRLATPRPPSRDAHTVKGSLGKVIMALPQPFRFLGIALYGFLQCELL
ncbi:MAG TPA: hypothetical protein V6D43_09680 [Candidatus Sericytochromatia bacterium]